MICRALCAATFANDQIGWQSFRLHFAAIVEKFGYQQSTGQRGVLSHCSQGGSAVGCESPVVETYDGDIFGNINPGSNQRANGAQRDQIARRHNAVELRPPRDQRIDGGLSSFEIEVSWNLQPRVGRKARFVERAQVALKPLHGLGRLVVAEKYDAAAAETGKMQRCAPAAER